MAYSRVRLERVYGKALQRGARRGDAWDKLRKSIKYGRRDRPDRRWLVYKERKAYRLMHEAMDTTAKIASMLSEALKAERGDDDGEGEALRHEAHCVGRRRGYFPASGTVRVGVDGATRTERARVMYALVG